MQRGRVAYASILFSVCAALACSANPDGDGGGAKVSQGGSNSKGGTNSDAGTVSLGATSGGPDIAIGGGDGGGVVGEATALKFDPPTITLVIDSATAAKTASYSLVATLKSGATAKVSAESLEFDRPDLAAAKNGAPVVLTATGAVAGKGILHAVYGGIEATAELDVQLVEKVVTGTIPAEVMTALDGGAMTPAADPTLTTLLYPYDKTVFALGLQSPQFMWTAPAIATDVYRLHVEQAGYKFDLYSAAAMPGKLTIPQDAWDRLTSSNTGDAMQVTLSRYDATAQKAYTSVTESFTIVPESLRGAIYY